MRHGLFSTTGSIDAVGGATVSSHRRIIGIARWTGGIEGGRVGLIDRCAGFEAGWEVGVGEEGNAEGNGVELTAGYRRLSIGG